MSKIVTLSKTLANQIAAGEVVERPVSVVKELVENSLDAGATAIKVEIKKGGIEYICVSDNGEGISEEDMRIATDKYTTSKISSLEDLYEVMTFGFRGEALSSISSVSEFSLISKTAKDELGKKLYFEGDEKKLTSYTCEVGTQIEVRSLFYNTPARLNYIKTEKTEYTHILEALQSMILAYPKVRFEFISDERKVFSFGQNDSMEYRVQQIMGNDFYENSIPLSLMFSGIQVSGFISDPKGSYSNKNRQKLYVNKRSIKSPMISRAVMDAYNRFIPHGSYPAYILFLEVDPTVVDVNVHPRKTEIRFADEKTIFRSVYHAINSELERVSLLSSQSTSSQFSQPAGNDTLSNTPSSPKYFTGSGTTFKNYSPYKNTSHNPNQLQVESAIYFAKNILDGNKDKVEHIDDKSFDVRMSPLGKIVGQVFNSYIIVEAESKLLIIDQHALAERVIYEKLGKKTTKTSSQGLLVPIMLDITPAEEGIIENYMHIFHAMGFDLELLSAGSIMISGIPDFIKQEDVKKLFLGVVDDVAQYGQGKSKTLDEVKNKIYAYTACRSAVKFGDPLSLFEINKLLQDSILDYSSTCPHGRPVVHELDIHDLKGKFER